LNVFLRSDKHFVALVVEVSTLGELLELRNCETGTPKPPIGSLRQAIRGYDTGSFLACHQRQLPQEVSDPLHSLTILEIITQKFFL
jgi:hypothetical protein